MKIKMIIKTGLLAGIIISMSAITMVPVVGNEMDLALAKFNLPPLSLGAMFFFFGVSITFGITLMWMYAAMLPAYRNRTKTMMIAVFLLWLPANFLANLSNVIYGFMPLKLTLIGIVWGLAELIVAGFVAMRFYKI